MSGQTAVLIPEPETPAVSCEPAAAPRAKEYVAIGSLRAFITVLVVAHHAALAYHPFAPPPPASLTAQPRWWQAFPVVDSHRWAGTALLVGFNDLFFMALMFFLSGLFVWGSLERKGSGAFLRDRALRLGLPFVVAAGVVAPLAYYPAHLQSGGAPGLAGFWRQWRSLGAWPAGPAWFVWLLLAFDGVAAVSFLLQPRWGERLARLASGAHERPARFFGLLVAASAVAYLPMVVAFGPFDWFSFGPFYFQTSRLFHYAVYFLAGIVGGAWGLERGLLAPGGRLARRWPAWLLASLGAFSVATVATILALAPHADPRVWGPVGGLSFVLSCAASSFAFLALFVRFARTRGRIFESLRANAYGIYLIHYAFVSWLQYALLKAPLSGLVKFAIAFVGAVVLSWAATAALRRVPALARVL